MGQKYTAITADQALYCKLMELKWSVQEYQQKIIPRLDGLHVSMNFQRVIGEHINGCGLVKAWIESNLLGPVSAEKAWQGKSYKAMRAHKITYQVLWRMLLPLFFEYPSLHQQITENLCVDAPDDIIIEMAQTSNFQKMYGISH